MTIEFKGTAVWYCDTEEEKFERMDELDTNPDFTYLGHYDMIQDIYEELENQGFSEDDIDEMSQNNYGHCLEIIEYSSHYDVYFGQR